MSELRTIGFGAGLVLGLCSLTQAADPLIEALKESDKYRFVTRQQAAQKEGYLRIAALQPAYPPSNLGVGGGASFGIDLGLPITRNTILVKFVPDVDLEQFDALLTEYGLRPHEELPWIPEAGVIPLWFNSDNPKFLEIHSQLPANQQNDYLRVYFKFLDKLEEEPMVEHAAPDSAFGLSVGAEVPSTAEQSRAVNIPNRPSPSIFQHTKLTPPIHAGNYGLTMIRCPAAWNFNDHIEDQDRDPVSLAVIDIGYSTHPDLDFQIHPQNPIAAIPELFINNTHGIHVAGIIAATQGNGQGIDGICKFCKIQLCNITNPGGIGTANTPQQYFSFTLGALAACIESDPPPKVINASLGFNWRGIRPLEQKPQAADIETLNRQRDLLEGTLKTARDRGILIISAGGNDSSAQNTLECQFGNIINYTALTTNPVLDNVIVVEAANQDHTRCDFSNNQGTIAAPGRHMYSLSAHDPKTYNAVPSVHLMSGTSQAVPCVTGVIALMYAYNPELEYQEVRKILLASGRKDLPGSPPFIDAYQAMLMSHPDSLIHLADLKRDGQIDDEDEQLLREKAAELAMNSADNYWPREDLNGDGELTLDNTKKQRMWVPQLQDYRELSDLGVLELARQLANQDE